MRKNAGIIARILVIVFVLNLFMPVTAFAAEIPTFEVGTAQGQPGETGIEIPIYIKNNPGIMSTKLSVKYDTTRLELVAAELLAKNWGGATSQSQKITDYPYILNWVGDKNYTEANATFAILTFSIRDDAPTGTASIEVTYDPSDVFDYDYVDIAFEIQNGGVTVGDTTVPHEHTWDEGVVTKQSTCVEAGEKTFTCLECGSTKVEEIPAIGHSLNHHDSVAATCTEPGCIEYWDCSGCGKYYSNAAATSEITKADTVIPALGHDYENGSCTRCGEPDPEAPVENPDIIASGYCGGEGDGTNLTWTLANDGTLTISGEGAMADYLQSTNTESSIAPWIEYKSSLKTLVIGNGVTSIGGSAFKGCSGFTGDLVMPDSVTSIGDAAFYKCSGFTGDLVIPKNVKKINSFAFAECDHFDGNLVLPNGVTSIGTRAFYQCYGLSGSLIIPDSVTNISDYAFSGCRSFSGSLVIPDGVTAIGQYAFGGYTGFKGDLIIPASVTSIGSGAFVSCQKLSGDVYFKGDAPSVAKTDAYPSGSFPTDFTLYYIPGTIGWTDSDAYDADAGTWNGYKLEVWETGTEHTHNLTRTAAKAATCTENGNIEYWYCSGCGKYYSNAAATSEITKADTVIPALGHDYKDGSCTRCGKADPSVPSDAPRLVVQPVTGRPGDTVEVKINVENNPGLVGIATVVTFDTTVLEYVSCEVGGDFSGMNNSHLNGGTLKTVWITGDGAVTSNSTFLTITFKINEDAEDGDTYITLDYDYDNTLDANEECIELATFGDYVTVFSGVLGDVNNSGTVTSLDARWILQYLSGAREFTEDQLALADVNGSGTVTSLDARWILQRLSGARDENFQAR